MTLSAKKSISYWINPTKLLLSVDVRAPTKHNTYLDWSASNKKVSVIWINLTNLFFQKIIQNSVYLKKRYLDKENKIKVPILSLLNLSHGSAESWIQNLHKIKEFFE